MTIEQIQAEVRRIVREQFAQGEPGGIRSALSTLFKSAKLDKELQAEMKRLAKAAEREIQDQFVNDRTDNTALDTLLKEASLLGGSVPPKVMDIVARGLRSGWSSAEIDEQLARILRTASHRVRTLRETARAVLTTQAVLANAEKNGVQYVRYGGTANAQREFCKQHVGKVYSIAEAKTLVNGFGQNAYLFRGGWNCRHRWEIVVGKPERNAPDRVERVELRGDAIEFNAVEFAEADRGLNGDVKLNIRRVFDGSPRAMRVVVQADKFKNPDTVAALFPDDGVVYVNPENEFWKNPIEYTTLNHEKGMWATSSIQHVAKHEEGHWRYFNENKERYTALRRVFSGEEARAAGLLSIRASVSPLEFLAEYYAAEKLGVQMRTEVKDLFNKIWRKQ